MKIVALVALGLFACVIGKPDVGFRPQRQCSRYCKESKNFKYEPGYTYVYNYEVDTVTSLSGTSNDESRLHLSAKAEISVISKCDFSLKLRDVLLEGSSPDDGSLRQPVPRSSEFSNVLQQNTLLFSFQDGKVENLCPDDGETTWGLNIKRGLLSAFQNSLKDWKTRQSTIYERDVTGLCETMYSASSTSTATIIRKNKDLTNCSHRKDHYLSLQSTPYSSSSNVHSLPVIKSFHNCKQEIDGNGKLKKATCNEVHVFRPFSNGHNGAVTKVHQNLKFINADARMPVDKSRSFNIRTTLLYQHVDEEANKEGREHTAMMLLEEIGRNIPSGLHTDTPRLFSQLVSVLKGLDHSQLFNVYSNVRNTILRKFVLDAMPLVGTVDALTLMIDCYKSQEVTIDELDSWLASLAFEKKPTLNMLMAVSWLLDESPPPKAILNVASLVHSYCQTNKPCLNDAVKDVMSKLERFLGDHCHSEDEEHLNQIILALKAIGNAGVATNLNTLKKCYQQMENPTEVRIAAIEAHRRLPCNTKTRPHLLEIFTNTQDDTEVRIAAYLAAMQCPTPQSLRSVADTLYKEEVNQVASFVWTHLTNIQETSSRWKQEIRALIMNDFLKNKFNTDVRKFSRNYEASTYFDSFNAGGAVESNVIFTPESYLPRSAMLNLTLDLFGQSVNVLEIGGRAEGFETTVENIFGPGGYYPDKSMQNILKKLRRKEEDGDLENNIHQLGERFNAKGKLNKEPKASVYARMFGNEILYTRFNNFRNILNNVKDGSFGEHILKLVLGEQVNHIKSFPVIEAGYTIPTVSGLPLELIVNGSATVGLKSNGHMNMEEISHGKFSVNGEFAPSAAMEITGAMSVNAFVTKSGISSRNKLLTNTYVGGSLTIEGGQLVQLRINMPRDKMEILHVSSKLFIHHHDIQHEVKGIVKNKEEWQGCSSDQISDISGIKLCGKLEYPNASEILNAPYFPLTGPSTLDLSLHKTDTFSAYEFSYKLSDLFNTNSTSRSVNIDFDTPGSKINRKIHLSGVYHSKDSVLGVNIITPLIKLSANGHFIRNERVTRIDGLLKVNDEVILKINTGMEYARYRKAMFYKPFFGVTVKGTTYLDVGGNFFYKPRLIEYKADVKWNNQTQPITSSGVLRLQKGGYFLNGSIVSSLFKGRIQGTFRQVSEYMSSHINVVYSTNKIKEQTIEISTKMLFSTIGDAYLRSIQSAVKMSQFPNYNLDLKWELRRGYNLFSHHLNWTFGNIEWQTAQLYRFHVMDEYPDVELLGMLRCIKRGLDYKINLKYQVNVDSIISYIVTHLGVKHKYIASMQYIKGYNATQRLDVELSYPGFNATFNGKLRETVQKHYEVALDMKYPRWKNSVPYHLEIKGFCANRNRSISQEWSLHIQIDGDIRAEISGSITLSENHADQQLKLVAFGETYTEKASYIFDGLHKVDVFLQLGHRNYSVNAIVKHTEEEKSMVINLFYRETYELSAKFLHVTQRELDKLEMEFSWNGKINRSRIYFTAKSIRDKDEFLFEYPKGRITGEVIYMINSLNAQLQWAEKKKIAANLQWNINENDIDVLATVETPWLGLEKQSLSLHSTMKKQQQQIQLELVWVKNNLLLSAVRHLHKTPYHIYDSVIELQLTSTKNTIPNITVYLNHAMNEYQLLNVNAVTYYNDQNMFTLQWKYDMFGFTAHVFSVSPWLTHPVNFTIKYTLKNHKHEGYIETIWYQNKRVMGKFLLQKHNIFTIDLTTPFSNFQTVGFEFILMNNSSNFTLSNKMKLNSKMFSLSLKKLVSKTQIELSGSLSTPFMNVLEAGFYKTFESKFIELLMLLKYDGHHFFKFNKVTDLTQKKKETKTELSINMNILTHSISFFAKDVWKRGNLLLKLEGEWNSETLSMILTGNHKRHFLNNSVHYHGKISGSVLSHEMEMDLLHLQTPGTFTTIFKLPGDICIKHVLKIQNLYNWENLLEVHTAVKQGSIKNIQKLGDDNSIFSHEMYCEFHKMKAQVNANVVFNTTLGRIDTMEFSIVLPQIQPITLLFQSEEDEFGIIKSTINMLYQEVNITFKSKIKFLLLQSSVEFELLSPYSKPLSLTAKYDLKSPKTFGIIQFQWGNNKGYEIKSDFQFSSSRGFGTATGRSLDTDEEFLKIVMTYNFENWHKIGFLECHLGGEKLQAEMNMTVHNNYMLNFGMNTTFNQWQNVVLNVSVNFTDIKKQGNVYFAKNGHALSISSSVNLIEKWYWLDLQLNSTVVDVPKVTIYASFDKRNHSNQTLDIICIFNEMKTELNANLQHTMMKFIDVRSLDITLKTPLKSIEILKTHFGYNNENDTFQQIKCLIIKDDWKFELAGESVFATFGSDAHFNLTLPFNDVKDISVSFNHRYISEEKQTVEMIISSGMQNVTLNGDILLLSNALSASVNIQPFLEDYGNIQTNFNLSAIGHDQKSFSIIFVSKEHHFKMSGILNFKSLLKFNGSVQTGNGESIAGISYDLTGIVNTKRYLNAYLQYPNRKYELKMLVDSVENNLSAEISLQLLGLKVLGKYEANERYCSSLQILAEDSHEVLNLEFLLQEALLNMQFICPSLGYNKLAFSGLISREDNQKSVIFTFVKNTQEFKLVAIGNFDLQSTEFKGEIVTPIENWEKINIHGKYEVINASNKEMKLVAVKGEDSFDMCGTWYCNDRDFNGSLDILHSSFGTASMTVAHNQSTGYSAKFRVEGVTGKRLLTGSASLSSKSLLFYLQSPFAEFQRCNISIFYDISGNMKKGNMILEYLGISSKSFPLRISATVDSTRAFINIRSPVLHPLHKEITLSFVYSNFLKTTRKPFLSMNVIVNRSIVFMTTLNLTLDWKNKVGIYFKFQSHNESRKFNFYACLTPKFPPVDMHVTAKSHIGTILDFSSVVTTVQNKGYIYTAQVKGLGEGEKSIRVEYYPKQSMKITSNITDGNNLKQYKVLVTFDKTANQLDIGTSFPGIGNFSCTWRYGKDFIYIMIKTPFPDYKYLSLEGKLDIILSDRKSITFFLTRNNVTTGINMFLHYSLHNAETLLHLMLPFTSLTKFKFTSQYDVQGPGKTGFAKLENNDTVYEISGKVDLSHLASDAFFHIFTPHTEFHNMTFAVSYSFVDYLNMKFKIHGNLNNIQKINMNFEFLLYDNEGRFLLASQSPMIDVSFIMMAGYNVSDTNVMYQAHMNIPLLNINATLLADVDIKESKYKRGIFSAGITTKTSFYQTKAVWKLQNERSKSVEVVTDVAGKRSEIKVYLKTNGLKYFDINLSSVLPSYGMTSFNAQWNALKRTKMECEITVKHRSSEVIAFFSSFEHAISAGSIKFNLYFNSPILNLEKLIFTSEITYSTDLTSKSVLQWSNNKNITLTGSLSRNPSRADMHLSFMDNIDLTIVYYSSGSKEIATSKLICSRGNLQLDIELAPYKSSAPEFNITIKTPFKGFSDVQLNTKYTFTDLEKSLDILYIHERYKVNLEISVSNENGSTNLLVNFKAPSEFLNEFIFEGIYRKSAELSTTLCLLFEEGKDIRSTAQFLKHSISIHANSTLYDWEDFFLQTAFIRNESVVKADLIVKVGHEIMFISCNVLPHDNDNSQIELNILSPWNKLITLKGVYQGQNGHATNFSFQNGEYTTTVQGNLNYVIQDDFFTLNISTRLNDIGILAVDAGYNITSSSNLIYLKYKLGKRNLTLLFESSRTKEGIKGRFHLQTPFQYGNKIVAFVEIGVSNMSGSLNINGNILEGGGRLSRQPIGMWLNLNAPTYSKDSISLDFYLDEKSLNVSLVGLEKKINIKINYMIQKFLFLLDTILEVSFIEPLKHVLLSVGIDSKNLTVSIKGQWHHDQRMYVLSKFSTQNSSIEIGTPFKNLHNIKISGNILSSSTSHRIETHLQWEEFTLDFESSLQIHKNNCTLKSILKWNSKENITLLWHVQVYNIHNSYIKSHFSFKTPFFKFDNFDIKLELKVVNASNYFCHFELSTPLTAIPGFQFSLVSVSDNQSNIKRTFTLKSIKEKAIALLVVNESKKKNINIKLDILTPLLNIAPFSIEGSMSFEAANIMGNIKLTSTASVYTANGYYTLHENNHNAKLEVKMPATHCDLTVYSNIYNGRAHFIINKNKLDASYNFKELPFLSEIHLIIPEFHSGKYSLNVSIVFGQSEAEMTANYTYQNHDGNLYINYDRKYLRKLYVSADHDFRNLFGIYQKAALLNASLSESHYSIDVMYNNGINRKRASLSISNNDEALEIVGYISSPDINEKRNSITFKKYGDHTQLNLFNWFITELSIKPDSGFLILSFDTQQHKLQYYIQSNDGFETNVQIKSPLLRNGTANVLIAFRNSGSQIQTKVHFTSGTQHQGASVELKSGKENLFKLEITSNRDIVFSLENHFASNRQTVSGETIISIYGIQNRFSFKQKTKYPLHFEIKIENPLFMKDTLQLLLNIENSLLLFAGYSDVKLNKYMMLEMTFPGDGSKMSINLQTPILSSFKFFTLNVMWNMDDVIECSLSSAFMSSRLPSFDVAFYLFMSQDKFASDFKMTTSIQGFEHYEGNVHIPLKFNNNLYLFVSFFMSHSNYSYSTTFNYLDQHLEIDIATQYKKYLGNATLRLEIDPIFLINAELNTPFKDYWHYSLNLQGPVNVIEATNLINYVEWNDKRIEMKYTYGLASNEFITHIELKTPFAKYDHYMIKLQYENNSRKLAIATIKYPSLNKEMGIEFDYQYQGFFNFTFMTRFNIPLLPRFQTNYFLVGNKLDLDEGSYKAMILSNINDKILSLSIDGLLNSHEAKLEAQANQNGRVIYLRALSSSWNKTVFLWELKTPLSFMRNMQIYFHHGPHKVQFFTIYNFKEIISLNINILSNLILLQVNNPIIALSFSYSLNTEQNIPRNVEFFGELKGKVNVGFSASFTTNSILWTRKEIKASLKLPMQTLSFNVVAEKSITKIEHAIQFSWKEGRVLGYHLLISDVLSNGTAFARIDFPFRSFEVSSKYIAAPSLENGILFHQTQFLWDAVADRNKKIGFQIQIDQNSSIQLIMQYAMLAHDISVQYTQNLGKGQSSISFRNSLKVIYSPLPEDTFIIETYLENIYEDEKIFNVGINVYHKTSNLEFYSDLDMHNSAELFSGNLNITYMEPSSGHYNNMFSSGKLIYYEPEIAVIFKTNENYILARGFIFLPESGYCNSSLIFHMNQRESLVLSAEIDTYDTLLNIGVSYGDSKFYAFHARFPNWQEVVVEGWHSLSGVKVEDGMLAIRLNTSRLLWTRIQWEPRMLQDMKQLIVEEYKDILYVAEAIAYTYLELFNTDFRVNLTTFTFEEVLNYMKNEVNAIQKDFKSMATDLSNMYNRNEFFMKDIWKYIKSTCTEICIILEQATKLIEKTWNVVYTSLDNFMTFIWETLSLDYIVTTLSNALKNLKEFVQLFVINIQQLLKQIRDLKLVITQQILETLEYAKKELFLLKENLDLMNEQLNLIIKDLVNELEDFMEERMERLQYYIQMEVKAAVIIITEIAENITKAVKGVQEVQELLEVYGVYATWLEEFHLQEYLDHIKDTVTEAVEVMIQDILKAVEDLKIFMMSITKPYTMQMKETPILSCIKTTSNEIYQKVVWIWNYFEITTQISNVFDIIADKADDILVKLLMNIQTDVQSDAKSDFIFRPDIGLVEYTQELPVDWKAFNEMPDFEQFSWYPLAQKSEEHANEIERYKDFFNDPLNRVINKTMNTILSPFTKRAVMVGKRQFVTFDNRYFEFEGKCSYLLASDFSDNKFFAILNSGSQNKSVTIISEGQHINIGGDGRVRIDGEVSELPAKVGLSTWVVQSKKKIKLNTDFGMSFECDLNYDICTLELTGWFFGKTGGLMGTFNNEPSDDISLPNGTILSDIQTFANSWKLKKNVHCQQNSQENKTNEYSQSQVSEGREFMCYKYFGQSSSPLSMCFSQIDPQPYNAMCIHGKDSICLSLVTYVTQCKKTGIEMRFLEECVNCQLTEQEKLNVGESKMFNRRDSHSADIIFVVEQSACLQRTSISDAISKLDNILKVNGINETHYGLVQFGGDDLYQPHSFTTNGNLWVNGQSIQKTLKRLQFKGEKSNPAVNSYDALKYAASLPFHGGVSRSIVLMQCGVCEMRDDYSGILQLLQENDITLHILQPQEFPDKMNILGADAEGSYLRNSTKRLLPSISQWGLTQKSCISLAFETNGTIFNLNHIINDNIRNRKKFFDTWSRSVTRPIAVPKCQKCECVTDDDSVGKIICSQCTSELENLSEDPWWSEEVEPNSDL